MADAEFAAELASALAKLEQHVEALKKGFGDAGKAGEQMAQRAGAAVAQANRAAGAPLKTNGKTPAWLDKAINNQVAAGDALASKAAAQKELNLQTATLEQLGMTHLNNEGWRSGGGGRGYGGGYRSGGGQEPGLGQYGQALARIGGPAGEILGRLVGSLSTASVGLGALGAAAVGVGLALGVATSYLDAQSAVLKRNVDVQRDILDVEQRALEARKAQALAGYGQREMQTNLTALGPRAAGQAEALARDLDLPIADAQAAVLALGNNRRAIAQGRQFDQVLLGQVAALKYKSGLDIDMGKAIEGLLNRHQSLPQNELSDAATVGEMITGIRASNIANRIDRVRTGETQGTMNEPVMGADGLYYSTPSQLSFFSQMTASMNEQQASVLATTATVGPAAAAEAAAKAADPRAAVYQEYVDNQSKAIDLLMKLAEEYRKQGPILGRIMNLRDNGLFTSPQQQATQEQRRQDLVRQARRDGGAK